jgi:hypothetical protein
MSNRSQAVSNPLYVNPRSDVVAPMNAPAGGGGPGAFRMPTSLGTGANVCNGVYHPDAPAFRFLTPLELFRQLVDSAFPKLEPAVEFVKPAETNFKISKDGPAMPAVDFEVKLANVADAIVVPRKFSWEVAVDFDTRRDAPTYGPSSAQKYSDSFQPTETGNRIRVAFPWIRGGRLTVTVGTMVDCRLVTGEFRAYISGENPGPDQVKSEAGDDTLWIIILAESSAQQFEVDAASKLIVPKYNRYNPKIGGPDGGAGLCQITPPVEADLWNWRANIASGKKTFNEKRRTAAGFAKAVEDSKKFQELCKQYNDKRLKLTPPKKPLKISVPKYGNEMLMRDTIRGYNGYAGKDYFLGDRHLHEYQIKVTNGALEVANLDETRLTGEAVWELVTDRPMNASYVDDVLKKANASQATGPK